MAVLSVSDVSIAFGGILALSGVTLSVRQREILGIIGPNGAGKTTLLNVICGIERPHHGELRLDAQVVTGAKPSALAALGLRRTFQASRLFPSMTVLENIMTGLHLAGSATLLDIAFRTSRMRQQEADMRACAMDALEFVGFAHYAERPGDALSFGEQRIVEIARALISEPKVLLLDEPAVGLSANRVRELDHLLRRVRDEKGVAVIMVEHVIRLVMGVSDRIVVLNSGIKIAEGQPDEIRANPDVIEAYLGRAFHAPRRAP
jgi:branched-chain amino acid transport system ATP-binding protein